MTPAMTALDWNKRYPSTDVGLTPYEFCALAEFRYIDAMRLYRARRSVGLAEAKAAMNKVLRAVGLKEL